jgi:L-serine dehydratase
MRYKDVFSIIGPAMIGPSSSHTAGAVRLGRVARQLLGELPQKADIIFYGSFAETYQGHGTDYAIVGGLFDYDTYDQRVSSSLETAEALGIEIHFKKGRGPFAHPNTVQINLMSELGKVKVNGSSVGGGNIEINKVNDFDVNFSGSYPTLVIVHQDRPGMIAELSHILAREKINIGYMDVDRKGRNGEAMTVIEVDSTVTPELIDEIKSVLGVKYVKKVDLIGGEAQ